MRSNIKVTFPFWSTLRHRRPFSSSIVIALSQWASSNACDCHKLWNSAPNLLTELYPCCRRNIINRGFQSLTFSNDTWRRAISLRLTRSYRKESRFDAAVCSVVREKRNLMDVLTRGRPEQSVRFRALRLSNVSAVN